jgi:hypothetical protein
MATLVPFVGPALGLATGATNAFNFFRKLADVPEDGYDLRYFKKKHACICHSRTRLGIA